MKNFFIILTISILCIISLALFYRDYSIYKKYFKNKNSYIINQKGKKEFKTFSKFNFFSKSFTLVVTSFSILIIYLLFDESDLFNLSFIYMLAFLSKYNLSINKDYIYRDFKLIKKSDIDYFNIDYGSSVIKLYLKRKDKPVIIIFGSDISTSIKILKELGYGDVLTRKIYNFNS